MRKSSRNFHGQNRLDSTILQWATSLEGGRKKGKTFLAPRTIADPRAVLHLIFHETHGFVVRGLPVGDVVCGYDVFGPLP
jgi:hypothetical protein